jgi:hypothetical protein
MLMRHDIVINDAGAFASAAVTVVVIATMATITALQSFRGEHLILWLETANYHYNSPDLLSVT